MATSTAAAPPPSVTNPADELHARFRRRLEQTVSTVHAWDTPFSRNHTIPDIRASLPWDDLRNDTGGKYAEPHRDAFLPGGPQARFVQRLARYFQRDVMSWVNAPQCSNRQCGNHNTTHQNTDSRMKHLDTREPLSQEELQGQASRVEEWQCQDCQTITTFPRFNNCATLFGSPKGRCGEYANLFGLYCRAVGFETRYVLDWTDHVWTEVKLNIDSPHGDPTTTTSPNNKNTNSFWWCMVDSCEGVIGEPSMYEAGWGKALTLMVSVGTHSIVDVTARYTRKLSSDAAMQQRRRQITTSEAMLHEIIREVNHKLQNTLTHDLAPDVQQLSAKARQQLQQQCREEEAELQALAQLSSWETTATYGKGRISGSAEWKEARQEAGKQNNPNSTITTTSSTADKDDATTTTFHSFQTAFWSPADSHKTTITIDPWAVDARFWIRLNQTIPCCHTTKGPLLLGKVHELPVIFAAVFFLVDDTSNNNNSRPLCGLWQSQQLASEQELTAFVATLPEHAIVALTGLLQIEKLSTAEEQKVSSTNALQRLGGFDSKLLYPSPQPKDDNDDNNQKAFENHDDWIVYLGQVDAHPTTWTKCCKARDARGGYEIQRLDSTSQVNDDTALCLTTLSNTRAHSICGRLDIAASASIEQKQAAFWQARREDPGLVGFTSPSPSSSSSDAQVYLLGETAHPLVRHGNAQKDHDGASWTTCLVLPKAVVPPRDRVAVSILEGDCEEEKDQAITVTTTIQYQVPTDLDFFHNQIGTQLVLPGSGSSSIAPTASVLENVRLVGLYFSASWCGPCRQFTPLLCEAYETWKDSHPTHGLEIVFVSSDRDPHSFSHYHNKMPWPAIGFDTLPQFKQQLSMIYGIRGIPSLVILDAVSGQVVVNASASRNELVQATRQGELGLERLLNEWLNRVPAATLELLSMLEVSCQDPISTTDAADSSNKDDMDRKEEAEKESPYWSYSSTSVRDSKDDQVPLPAGPYADAFLVSPSPSSFLDKQEWEQDCLQRISKSDMKPLLDTLVKYVANCRKSPSVVKFRHFRVSNKVVDRGITRIPHSLTLLQTWGLEVALEGDDYAISIPVSLDLEELSEDLEAYQEEYC